MRVLVWHTAGFALGIALGDVLRLPVPATLFLALAALAFTLLVFFRTGNLRLLVILSLFIGIFWGQIHHLEYQDLTFKPGERIQAVGTAVGEPSPTATGKAFLFQVSRSNDIQDTKLKVRVICDSREEVHYGDVLKISGKILDTPVPSNPHQFNYDAYLKRHGIAGTVSTMYGGTITPLGENRGNKLLQAVYGLKGKMDRVLSQLPSNQQSFIGGMLFGDKGNLSFEERNILSQTGLMDAFAVSGVHVGYVIFFTLSLAQVLKLGKWGRFILTFFTVLFYAALSEFTPSVLRSGAMALLGLLAYSLGEKKDFYTACRFSTILFSRLGCSLSDAGCQKVVPLQGILGGAAGGGCFCPIGFDPFTGLLL